MVARLLAKIYLQKTCPMRLTIAKVSVVILVPIILFSQPIYQDGSLMDLCLENVGCGMLFLAAMGRIWAAAYISGKKGKQLVVSGPYSFVRHPLYLFSAIGFLGAGLALESLTLAVFFMGVFLLSHYPTMIREERWLVEQFGSEARTYLGNKSRLLPRFCYQTGAEEDRVNLRVYTRAVLDAALIGLVFPGANTLEWLHFHRVVPTLMRLY